MYETFSRKSRRVGRLRRLLARFMVTPDERQRVIRVTLGRPMLALAHRPILVGEHARRGGRPW